MNKPVIQAVTESKTKASVSPQASMPAFRIEQLFGSRTRARLLGLFLENSHRAFFVRELARRIDAQLNSVRLELKNLVDVGIVLEVDAETEDPESSARCLARSSCK